MPVHMQMYIALYEQALHKTITDAHYIRQALNILPEHALCGWVQQYISKYMLEREVLGSQMAKCKKCLGTPNTNTGIWVIENQPLYHTYK